MYPNAYMPCMMNTMAMPQQYGPITTMIEQQLENMYPKTYHIVYPRVRHHCDMLDMNYGCNYCPTKEQVDDMCDRICKEVEKDVETSMKDDMKDDMEGKENRQLGFGSRRLLRDLVGILLIRELIRRRRGFGFPFFRYPLFGYQGYVY